MRFDPPVLCAGRVGKAGQRRDPRTSHQFLAISQNAPAFLKSARVHADISYYTRQ